MCVLHLLVYQPTHGRDLFVLKGCTYLLLVVYFSRNPEVHVIQLATTTSTNVIGALKSVFARHGIPVEVVSDNGPQFVSEKMKEFAFTVWSLGNGHAERVDKTAYTNVTHR